MSEPFNIAAPLTVKFYLKEAKTKGKIRQGEVSIVAKVWSRPFKEKNFELPTGEKIIPKFWDSRAQCLKYNASHALEVNEYLHEFKRNIIRTWRENPNVSFAQFKNLVRKPSEKKTFALALKSFIEAYSSDKSESTVKRYRILAMQMAKFVDSELSVKGMKREARMEKYFEAIQSIDITKINLEFYDQFKKHLQQTLIDSSLYKVIANLKTVLTWAKGREYPVNPVYQQFEVENPKTTPISFTAAELSLLENAKLLDAVAIARDYQVIECRTGMRISDILNFDASNFNPETGHYSFTVTKGRRLKQQNLTAYLYSDFCAPALGILKKYNFQLPKLSEQKINEHIKTACDLAGIRDEVKIEYYKQARLVTEIHRKCDIVTTHVGRKTFINLAIDSGMSVKTVSEVLGVTMKVIEGHYLTKGNHKVIEEQFNKKKTG